MRSSPSQAWTPKIAAASAARNQASSASRRRCSTSTAVQPALPHAQLTASIWPAGLSAAEAVLATSATIAIAQASRQSSDPRSTRTDPTVIATAITSHMADWKANEA